MTVRPDPKYPGRWIIDCRPDGYKGKRLRQPFEGSEDEARAWERAIMRRHAEIIDPRTSYCSAIFIRWITYYRNNRSATTAADAEGAWKKALKPVFGKLAPKHITRAIIEQYKTSRINSSKRGQEGMSTVKPRTVNKELTYLSSMLKWAAENGYCDPLPFAIRGFPRAMTRPPKPRPLTPEQVTLIWEIIEDEYKLAFLLMADAGLRATEALHLRVEHIEFAHDLMYVTGKGSKERIVPITTSRLRQALLAKRSEKGWLSCNRKTGRPYTSIKSALARAAKKAGLEKHLYHHLLRHSFGTNATVSGIDPNAIKDMMGHADLQTTLLYQHLAGDYLRRQAMKMDALVSSSRPHGKTGSDDEDNGIKE